MAPAILDPIPGANPSGSNALYDPAYNLIYERVRRARGGPVPDPLDSETHDSKEDWGYVAVTCRDVLRHRSKDLRVAAWLVEAKLALNGLPGLKDGLDFFRELAEKFWETLYPKIDDGDLEARERVFTGLSARLAEAVGRADANGQSARPMVDDVLRQRVQELDGCLDALQKLAVSCDARFGEFSPNLDLLRQALHESVLRVRQDLVERTKPASAARNVSEFPADTGVTQLFRRLIEAEEAPVSEPPSGTTVDETGDMRRVPAGVFPSHAGEFTRILNGLPPSGATAALVSARIDFTLATPAVIAPQVPFELFVWMHEPQERFRVLARAREELRSGDLLARTRGPFRIPQGASITVRLRIVGALIDVPEDTMIWEGESTCVCFVVTLPEISPDTKCSGTAHVYAEGIQIARIPFLLSAAGATDGIRAAMGIHHRTAFASYASDDRDAVLGRIQGIQKIAPELNVFLDVLSLRSGQNWEQELWRVIPASDIFYLFWSAHARSSEWVEKEWRCALRERGIGFIDPVPLESPETSPPPPELSSLHFNDWTVAFKQAAPAAPPPRIPKVSA